MFVEAGHIIRPSDEMEVVRTGLEPGWRIFAIAPASSFSFWYNCQAYSTHANELIESYEALSQRRKCVSIPYRILHRSSLTSIHIRHPLRYDKPGMLVHIIG
jgi:hypothetical protein